MYILLLFTVTMQLFCAEQESYDVDNWKQKYPYHTLIDNECPRHFDSTPKDSPLDLRIPGGTIIDTPKSLIQVIQVRELDNQAAQILETSKSDVFVWSKGEPAKPYHTKIGGIPFRPSKIPWPQKDGVNYTFVMQVYFGDSLDILDDKLPGDVLLIYGLGEDFWAGNQSDLLLEWMNSKGESKLIDPSELPPSGFYVPILHGVICRIPEYSDGNDIFEKMGRNVSYLLARTQATKIGKEPFWIQGDEKSEDETVFFTFSGPSFGIQNWPLVNAEKIKHENEFKGYGGYQNEISFSMGDAGCIYFLINKDGNIRWMFQCY